MGVICSYFNDRWQVSQLDQITIVEINYFQMLGLVRVCGGLNIAFASFRNCSVMLSIVHFFKFSISFPKIVHAAYLCFCWFRSLVVDLHVGFVVPLE